MNNKSLTCQPHLAQYAILRSLPSILARFLPCRGRYGFGVSLYRCRENSTNPPFFTKQTQFFPIFHPKTTIPQKNKPNSNPIQTQTNPILAQKQGLIMRTKPIQSQSCPRLVLTLLFCRGSNPIQNLSSIGAYLLPCRGANFFKGKKTNAFSRKVDYTMKNNDLLAKLTTLKGAKNQGGKPNTKLVLDWCLLASLSGTQS